MVELLRIVILFVAFGTATVSRHWCLGIIAFFLPLTRWLPAASFAGLNSLNLLLLPVLLHTFLTGKIPDSKGRRDPVLIPAVVLMLFMLISVLQVQFSEDLPAQFLQRGGLYSNTATLKEMLVGFLLYFCSRSLVGDPRTVRIAVIGAMGGFLLQAGMAAVDFIGGVEFFARAKGSLGESNELGQFLAAYAMIPIAIILDNVRHLLTIALPSAAVALMGILGTLSRGALIAAALAGTFMALVRRNAYLVLVAAVIASSPLWLPQNILNRFSETVAKDQWGLSSVPGFESSEKFDLNREVRFHLWRAGLKMIVDKPLFGVGLGQYKYSLRKYGYTKRGLRGPHNVYLWIGAQAGIPALLAHMAILLGLGKTALRLARLRSNALPAAFGLGVLGTITSFTVGGMFLSGFYSNSFSGPFWILAGIAVNLYNLSENDSTTKGPSAVRRRWRPPSCM